MYLERLRLDGKNALVFGAGGSGMSLQTSLALAEAGATIVPVDFSEERVEQARSRIAEIGGRCAKGTTANLRDIAETKQAVATAIDQVGEIHLLANVAGGTLHGEWMAIEDTTDEVFASVLSLNLGYVFVACREVGKHMITRGIKGSIVSYASVSGYVSAPYHGPYGAAKAGLMALMRTMAVEWGRYGIRVNSVAPGGVGGAPRNTVGDGNQRPDGPNLLPTPLTAEDVPCAVLFLLSDLAAKITGQTIAVDAGVTARSPFGDASIFERLAEIDAGLIGTPR